MSDLLLHNTIVPSQPIRPTSNMGHCTPVHPRTWMSIQYQWAQTRSLKKFKCWKSLLTSYPITPALLSVFTAGLLTWLHSLPWRSCGYHRKKWSLPSSFLCSSRVCILRLILIKLQKMTYAQARVQLCIGVVKIFIPFVRFKLFTLSGVVPVY